MLSPYLKKYIASDEQSKILFLLFPQDLVDELVEEENPEDLIEDAVRKYLAAKK